MQNRVAPSAWARRAVCDNLVPIGNKPLTLDTGRVVRALRAIGAILGAAARLDRKQLAALHFARRMVLAMDLLSGENQVKERPMIDFPDFFAGPIGAN